MPEKKSCFFVVFVFSFFNHHLAVQCALAHNTSAYILTLHNLLNIAHVHCMLRLHCLQLLCCSLQLCPKNLGNICVFYDCVAQHWGAPQETRDDWCVMCGDKVLQVPWTSRQATHFKMSRSMAMTQWKIVSLLNSVRDVAWQIESVLYLSTSTEIDLIRAC